MNINYYVLLSQRKEVYSISYSSQETISISCAEYIFLVRKATTGKIIRADWKIKNINWFQRIEGLGDI